MRNRILPVAAILLLALTLGLLFAHVLEMGPKLAYPPALYTRLNTSLYPFFGTVGAVVQVAALLCCAALAIVVRHDRTAFLPTAVSALVQAVVLALWFAIVSPVNDAFIAARPAIPPDFDALRAQWETGHTIDAALMLAALILLLAGWVRPARTRHDPASRARHSGTTPS